MYKNLPAFTLFYTRSPHRSIVLLTVRYCTVCGECTYERTKKLKVSVAFFCVLWSTDSSSSTEQRSTAEEHTQRAAAAAAAMLRYAALRCCCWSFSVCARKSETFFTACCTTVLYYGISHLQTMNLLLRKGEPTRRMKYSKQEEIKVLKNIGKSLLYYLDIPEFFNQ